MWAHDFHGWLCVVFLMYTCFVFYSFFKAKTYIQKRLLEKIPHKYSCLYQSLLEWECWSPIGSLQCDLQWFNLWFFGLWWCKIGNQLVKTKFLEFVNFIYDQYILYHTFFEIMGSPCSFLIPQSHMTITVTNSTVTLLLNFISQ